MYLAVAIQLSIICIIQSATQNDTQACSACCISAPGIPGIPGRHGYTGAPGPVGIKGDVGGKGEQGSQGVDGRQGVPGAAGQKGRDGRQGFPGKMGPIGFPGDTGKKGEKGKQGLKGDVGMKGEKGNQGLDGRDGIPGEIGPIGLGAPGQKGNKGVKGIKGQIGPKGASGEKGNRGEKGEQPTKHKSAFTVAFSSNPGRLPISPMKYPVVITNTGGHYNKQTGKFVCRYSGTYVFQFASAAQDKKPFATILKKNGVSVAATWEDDGTAGSNMAVLHLRINDQVWTQPYSENYNYYYSDRDKYCTFSGFLLYED